MSKIIRTALATAILSGAVSGVALSSSVTPAQARACFLSTELDLVNGFVSGARSRYCDPPGVDNPLPTTLQRKSGASWFDIGVKVTGGAYYHCVGTVTHTYRLKETPSLQKSLPCS